MWANKSQMEVYLPYTATLSLTSRLCFPLSLEPSSSPPCWWIPTHLSGVSPWRPFFQDALEPFDPQAEEPSYAFLCRMTQPTGLFCAVHEITYGKVILIYKVPFKQISFFFPLYVLLAVLSYFQSSSSSLFSRGPSSEGQWKGRQHFLCLGVYVYVP